MTTARAFWLQQALAAEGQPAPQPPLQGEVRTDICIVGGGYTGLWTAIKIKQKDPFKSVVVVEKDICGAGASGRNGGCMLTFSSKYPSLVRLFGEREAARLVRASEQAVFDIEAFCRTHQLQADVRTHGALYTATNASQLGTLDPVIERLRRAGLNRWQPRTAEQLSAITGSAAHLAGHFNSAAGSLQPGMLVRGLARVAREMGIEIYEHSPMQHFRGGDRPLVQCPQGGVSCERLVLALNAWAPAVIPELRRSVVLVSSDMVITRPMATELERVGLNHGTAIADSRIFVHYYRTTGDGRLMLGKGGNHFAFANRVGLAFDGPSRYQSMLQRTFQRLFPRLPCELEQSWSGASDRSVTGLPFFGRLRHHPNTLYGLGYSGNGVVQSFLGGEILAALALDIDNDWSRSGLAHGCRGQFPPEPLRHLGALAVKGAIRRKESREDRRLSPFYWDRQLARLAGSAGKVDQ